MPLNESIKIIANIQVAVKLTKAKLESRGIDLNSALTNNLRDSFFANSLRGLKDLSALRERIDFKLFVDRIPETSMKDV